MSYKEMIYYRISSGRYEVEWHKEIDVSKLTKEEKIPWNANTLNLKNDFVAQGRAILIHNGNTPKNSDGCLLINQNQVLKDKIEIDNILQAGKKDILAEHIKNKFAKAILGKTIIEEKEIKEFVRNNIEVKVENGFDTTQSKKERKIEIDLRGKKTPNGGIVEWISQFNTIFGTPEKQRKACNRACVYILQNAGVSQIETPLKKKVTYQIAIEKGVEYKETNQAYKRSQNINVASTTNPSDYMRADIRTFEAGLAYLDSELEKGYPVIAGTDHHYNYNGGYNNDLSTDHFVVIVGRGYDERGLFYRFYEVGTNREDANKKKFGISDDNKFYIGGNMLQGTPAHNTTRNYLVTQIRINKTYRENE